MEKLQERRFGFTDGVRARCSRRGARRSARFRCSVSSRSFTRLRGRVDLAINTCSIRATFRARVPECLEAGCGTEPFAARPQERFLGGLC